MGVFIAMWRRVRMRSFARRRIKLEGKLKLITAPENLHRWRHPHPRVTAVAKTKQPPRRLPSPASGRGIFRKRLSFALTSGRGIFRERRLRYSATKRARD